MFSSINLLLRRLTAPGLPTTSAVEKFGMEGEEVIARMLSQHFDCVIRNVIVPHKNLFLEKDFMVVCEGVPFVLEIKNWKGEIVCENGTFYQLKERGVRKKCKDPVGTTQQFIGKMCSYYGITGIVFGAVVFAEPDCTLSLPPEMDSVALIDARELVSHIKTTAKKTKKQASRFNPENILRCTRCYNRGREFCKGILADPYLPTTDKNGCRVKLDTTRIKYLSVEHIPFRLRDKLYVTFTDGKTDVFYNRDALLTIGLLDGTFRKFALNKIEHIVF